MFHCVYVQVPYPFIWQGGFLTAGPPGKSPDASFISQLPCGARATLSASPPE